MQQVKKAVLFLLIVTCFPLSLFSQKKNFPQHEFSVNGGYGFTLGDISGLTLGEHRYEKQFSKAPVWGAQYHFRFTKWFSIGLVYSGYTASGSHAEGSDDVSQHYISPQFSVYMPTSERWQIRGTVGIGHAFYRNDSKVFGKPRIVTGRAIAAHAGFCGTYKLTPHLGILAEVQCIVGALPSYSSRYNDKSLVVRAKRGEKVSLSRLNFITGLSYHF